MRLAISDHAQETASRVIVLLVFPQMRSQFIDALGQDSHLYLRRTSIFVVNTRFLDDFGLLSRA
jgi:hypothetical protein